jgi:hypothetical protein
MAPDPKPPKDLAASVRQRLLNRARADESPFAELLQYYAMERFLFRLSVSPHARRFGLTRLATRAILWE